MKPELSCIIITLNEEKYLPKMLDSLKKQTYEDFEIIVADYNSQDNTRKIAKSYGCKIVEGGNYSVGRNNGSKAAKGKYLLFLDADCELPLNFLQKNLEAFKKSKKGTATVEVKPLSNNYFDKTFFKLYDCWSRMMSRISPHCAGCGIFVKKEVFEILNGFDETVIFAENHDFTRRAKKYGFAILPVPIFTSVRRIKKEGRLRFILKYIYSGIYRLTYKEVKKPLFNYSSDL